jgi:hypothetical protein
MHQYTNEQSTYIYDINNDNDYKYNQYHYPQQCQGDEEYSSYNYEGGIHESSQYNNEDNSVEHDETNTVPQYPAVPDFFVVAPSDEKTVIG